MSILWVYCIVHIYYIQIVYILSIHMLYLQYCVIQIKSLLIFIHVYLKQLKCLGVKTKLIIIQLLKSQQVQYCLKTNLTHDRIETIYLCIHIEHINYTLFFVFNHLSGNYDKMKV